MDKSAKRFGLPPFLPLKTPIKEIFMVKIEVNRKRNQTRITLKLRIFKIAWQIPTKFCTTIKNINCFPRVISSGRKINPSSTS